MKIKKILSSKNNAGSSKSFNNSFQKKLSAFKIILKENTKAVKEIKRLEKLNSGFNCPSLKELQESYESLSEKVLKMIESFEVIVPDKYPELFEKFSQITSETKNRFNHLNKIERAVGRENKIPFLQTRPLAVISSKKTATAISLPPPRIQGGIKVSPGCTSGKIFKAGKRADLFLFPEDSILAVKQALTVWAPLLCKARGLVSEEGKFTCHLANVAREFQIPAIMDMKGVMNSLFKYEIITLDADNLVIYPGEIKELNQINKKTASGFSQCDEEERNKIYKDIVSLKPTDSRNTELTPQNSMNFHDIIRFIQKKSVEEIKRPDNTA